MRLLISNANQFKVKHDLMFVGVLTFVTVLVWIVYSIYVAYNKPTVDEEISSLLEPLDSTLDSKALAIVSDRFNPPEEFTILVKYENGDNLAVGPIGQRLATVEASQSAQITPTPARIATSSASPATATGSAAPVQ